METISRSDIYFLDGFCGAGGASLGIERAGCEVAIAVNHDERAIWAHNANHPHTIHLNTDIRLVDIADVVRRLISRGIYRINIWWSAECTHFSNAKGGASRDADSRMLSEELIRYISQLEALGIAVDMVFVENVREFFSWTALVPKFKKGKRLKAEEKRYSRVQIEMFDAVAAHDLEAKERLANELDAIYARFQSSGAYDMDGDGKITMLPDSATKGLLYLRWCDAIKSLGYKYDHRMLNAADFGAYQSRDRYFGIFIKRDLGIDVAFPKPTHSKNPTTGSLFDAGLKPWKACRDILDLADKGESIFYGRAGRKPLVPATLARIRFGIMKFKGDATMIDRSNTGASPINSDSPLPTVRASFENGVVHVATVDNCTFGADEVPVNGPIPTIMAKRDKYLMQAFVVPSNFTNPPLAVDGPLPTLMASRKHQYLCVPFMTELYGNGMAKPLDASLGTVMTKDKIGLCTPFIAQSYSSEGRPNQVSSCGDPLWAVTTWPKANLVVPFMVAQYGESKATGMQDVVGALTANPKHSINTAFLCKYYGNGDNATPLDTACGTVTTKDRFGVVDCSFLNYYYGGGKGNSNTRNTSLNAPINTVGCSHNAHAINAQIIATNDAWPMVLQIAPKPPKNGNVIVPAWTRIVNGYQVDNRIIDIHYRMLKVSELKLAQGFPANYILDPTSETVAKKHIGNAVHVDMAHVLVEANCGERSAYRKAINALAKTADQIA